MPILKLTDQGEELISSEGIGQAEVQAIWNQTERAEPELWRRCYPRIYQPYKPDLYCSPKQVGRQMFSTAMKVETGHTGQSEQYEIMWASYLAERKAPLYWVSRDMVDAVMQTTPPVVLDWYNMKLPHEAAVFMLPKGSLAHDKEGEVQYISYCRCLKDRWVPSVARRGPKQLSSANGCMLLFSRTAGYMTHYNIPHNEFPTVNLGAIDEAITQYEDHVHSSGWLTVSMDKEDTKVGIKVAHLLFGLLLLMLRKPELVTDGKLINKVEGKDGQAPKEFWTPSVIGQHYKIRRMPGPSLGGTHASPRGHWVRGFWKDQRYGVGLVSIKEIWIEPYWRGGDE